MAQRSGLSLDLNVVPDENQLCGVNVCADSEERQGTFRQELSSQLVIDVDDFDDEVLPSSSKAFHQAGKTSRTRKRSLVISNDDDDVEICRGIPPYLKVHKRKRSTLCQQQGYDNQKDYIDLEAAPRKQGDNVQEPAQLPPQVPAMEARTFSCPICMDNLKNETSTKCGHIFCEGCIKKALTAKKCCPTCRKKLRVKDIIRIYLPDVNRG